MPATRLALRSRAWPRGKRSDQVTCVPWFPHRVIGCSHDATGTLRMLGGGVESGWSFGGDSAIASSPVRAIIFDLDNCLAAADEVGEQLLEPVFAAVREANDGALTPSELDAAFRDCWVHAFD